MTVPHFATPFRIDAATGGVAVVEQDSYEDVAGCVAVVVGTRPGQRPLVPDLGTPEMLFARDVDSAVIISAATDWEPRATVVVEAGPDAADALVRRVNVGVEVRED